MARITGQGSADGQAWASAAGRRPFAKAELKWTCDRGLWPQPTWESQAAGPAALKSITPCYVTEVRIIASSRLREMAAPWPQARQEIEAWLGRVRVVTWNTAADVRQTDPRASIVGNRRVVFDFCNNDLRLVVKIDYQEHQVFIRWFGTHRDYDRITVEEV